VPDDNGSYVLLTNHLVPTGKCILRGVVVGLFSSDIDLDPFYFFFVASDRLFICLGFAHV